MAIELTDLTQEIFKTAKRVEGGVNILTSKAKEFAEAEKEYRIAFAKEILKLKSDGMAITILQDVAKGNVAEIRFKRDLAEELYKSSREMLQALQSELSALQSILKIQKDI